MEKEVRAVLAQALSTGDVVVDHNGFWLFGFNLWGDNVSDTGRLTAIRHLCEVLHERHITYCYLAFIGRCPTAQELLPRTLREIELAERLLAAVENHVLHR